jgi:hypothetical protein
MTGFSLGSTILSRLFTPNVFASLGWSNGLVIGISNGEATPLLLLFLLAANEGWSNPPAKSFSSSSSSELLFFKQKNIAPAINAIPTTPPTTPPTIAPVLLDLEWEFFEDSSDELDAVLEEVEVAEAATVLTITLVLSPSEVDVVVTPGDVTDDNGDVNSDFDRVVELDDVVDLEDVDFGFDDTEDSPANFCSACSGVAMSPLPSPT